MAVLAGVKPRHWRWRQAQARHGPIGVDPVIFLPAWRGYPDMLMGPRPLRKPDIDTTFDATVGQYGREFHSNVDSSFHELLGGSHVTSRINGLTAITVAVLLAFDGTPALQYSNILGFNDPGGVPFKLMTGTTATKLFGELRISGTQRQTTGDASYTIVSGTYFWAVLRWASGGGLAVDAFNIDGVKQAGTATSANFSGSLTATVPHGLILGVKAWMGVAYVFPKSLTDAEMLLLAKYPWQWQRQRPQVVPGVLPVTGGLGGPAAFMMLGGGPHK